MKKIFVILLIVLALITASAVWIMRSAGPADAAALLPAETVALASLPDLPRSASRWPKTTLAKIGAEPEMRAFLERPLQYLAKDRGGDEAAGILWKLKPGRIFAAVVSLSSKESALLVGVQFWGGKSGHDPAIARLRGELSRGGPASEVRREKYHGVEIVSSDHQGFTLYNASQGQWGFLSNNLPALKDAIDRAAGRKKEGSLADSPRYKEVFGKLVGDADLLLFCQPRSVLETLLEVGSSMGEQPIAPQVEQLRKVEAVGATTKFDEANLRDDIFVLRRNPPDVGSLDHAAMKFTSNETAAYFEFVSNFSQIFTATSNAIATRLMSAPRIQGTRLPQLIPEAFGPNCAVSVSWAPQQMRPTGIIAVQIKDPAKAEESVQEWRAVFPEASVTELEGIRYFSFPSLQTAFANPTLALVEGFLILGVNPGELNRSLQAFKSGETLEKSPAFASALSAYGAANEVFGYADSKVLFERGFPTLRQIIVFGAAVVPGASAIVDGSKLPQTETIAKHLQPIIYKQTRIPEGYLVESTGPITMNQAVLLGAAAGGWLLKPALSGQ
ncbi:MAG TPA: hypothetical protein VIS96_06785 [Terrimicrobiaceae bacterium]